MLYSDDFILSLPEELENATFVAVEHLLNKRDKTPDEIREARDLIAVIYSKHKSLLPDALGGNDSGSVLTALIILKDQLAQKIRTSRFELLLGGTFHYDFTEADTKRIQTLLNELRDLIQSSTNLTKTTVDDC